MPLLGIEVSLEGSTIGVVTGYHVQNQKPSEGGEFELKVPYFEDSRYLQICKENRVLSRIALKNFNLYDYKGSKVKVYDLEKIGINTTLPQMEELLKDSEIKSKSSETAQTGVFELKNPPFLQKGLYWGCKGAQPGQSGTGNTKRLQRAGSRS